MGRLILQRSILGVLTLLAASALIFIGTEILPGDLASAILQNQATPETLAKLRLDLGLDKPAIVRYVEWLFGALRGDFGHSLANGRDVLEEIAPRFANTMFLAAYAAVVAVPLAVGLGLAAAIRQGGVFDRTVNVLTLMTISVPEYFLAYLLIKYVAVDLGWFPSLANVSSDTPFLDRLYYAFLPMLTLVLVIVAHMMRMTRASVLAVMASPYIEMAILKGLTKTRIVLRHALPNALAPIISVDRAEPRLSHRRRGRGRDRVRLSRPRATDGRRGLQARRSRRAGLRPHLRGDVHPPQHGRRHPLDPVQSAPAAAALRVRRCASSDTSSASRAQIGLAIVALNLVVAMFAPLIAPYDQTAVLGDAWADPDAQHWLGLDNLGRDLLSRLIYGARMSIGLSLVITALSFFIGIVTGFAAAVAGGWVDQALSRLVDLLLSMPTLIFAFVILSVLGSGLPVLIVTIAVLDSTKVFRLARSVAVGLVSLEFVEAARLRGEGWWWIITREILPNAIPPLTAEFGLRFCFTFLFIAALSFLGLGVQPPAADWGSMVKDYRDMINFGSAAPIYPAAAIAVLTIGVNFVVDWMLSIHSRGQGEGA